MIIENLKREMAKKGITAFRLSRMTGIGYKRIRRLLNNRVIIKMSAEELVQIIACTGIRYENIAREEYDFGWDKN